MRQGALQEFERSLILSVLVLFKQNRTKAAHFLGVSIRTLRNKIKEYGGRQVGFIEVPEELFDKIAQLQNPQLIGVSIEASVEVIQLQRELEDVISKFYAGRTTALNDVLISKLIAMRALQSIERETLIDYCRTRLATEDKKV